MRPVVSYTGRMCRNIKILYNFAPPTTEDDVRAAAFEADLVDVKVIAFSETLSALKLVIPLAKR